MVRAVGWYPKGCRFDSEIFVPPRTNISDSQHCLDLWSPPGEVVAIVYTLWAVVRGSESGSWNSVNTFSNLEAMIVITQTKCTNNSNAFTTKSEIFGCRKPCRAASGGHQVDSAGDGGEDMIRQLFVQCTSCQVTCSSFTRTEISTH